MSRSKAFELPSLFESSRNFSFQAAKAKKKKGFVAPSHPFARTTKDQAKKAARAAREPVASTSAQTLDDDGLPAAKRKKTSMDPAFVAPMRESSRRSAVEFKKGVKDRLVESEKRRVRVCGLASANNFG